MPNGRSGMFGLKPGDFEQLLKQLDGDTVVGEMLDEPVTVSEMVQILGKWKRDHVVIEEQHHSWYYVHFPEWVTIGEDSPIFESVRRAYREYLINRA